MQIFCIQTQVVKQRIYGWCIYPLLFIDKTKLTINNEIPTYRGGELPKAEYPRIISDNNGVYNPHAYKSFRFDGKFTDNSKESDWKWTYNGEKHTIPVDPVTKEFDYIVDDMEGSLYNAFDRTSNIKSIVSFPDTYDVTDMGSMFYGCYSLTSLDLSNFDTSNVTDMSNMFSGCTFLTSLDLSNFDTSNVTYMSNMFSHCSSLTSLDLSNFDTSKVVSMGGMFSGCSRLTSINLYRFDTSNVKEMDCMFSGCSYFLKTLDLSNFDTSKLWNMAAMFYNCTSLTTLRLTNWDFSNVWIDFAMENMFYGCSCLTTVYGPIKGIKVDLDLSSCPLTNASAMVFINGLENETDKTITFKASTYNTLTDAQKKIATDKGWTVAYK